MKGQAMIEYVTTYGWAIFALVIIIGALIFSGVLSPTYLISEECNMGSNFPCNFAIYNKAGSTYMGMLVYNGFAYKIRVANLTVEDKSTGTKFDFSAAMPQEVASGKNFTISNAPLQGGFYPDGHLKRLTVHLTYFSCAPEVAVTPQGCSDQPHTVTGRVVGRVIPE